MFIQIGSHGFNTNHITRCRRFIGTLAADDEEEMSIEVHTSDGGYIHLKGENAQIFARFWDSIVTPMASTDYWALDIDPMEPNYEKLAAEEAMTASADSRDVSGVGLC